MTSCRLAACGVGWSVGRAGDIAGSRRRAWPPQSGDGQLRLAGVGVAAWPRASRRRPRPPRIPRGWRSTAAALHCTGALGFADLAPRRSGQDAQLCREWLAWLSRHRSRWISRHRRDASMDNCLVYGGRRSAASPLLPTRAAHWDVTASESMALLTPHLPCSATDRRRPAPSCAAMPDPCTFASHSRQNIGIFGLGN